MDYDRPCHMKGESFNMSQEEFKKVYEKYNPIFAPIISKMIQDNYKYFQISETIKWGFGYSNDLAIMGTCDRNNNEIHLNIFSVKKAYEDNNLMDVEYFIIHEARHIFQHIKIKEHKAGINNGVDPNLIEKWIYEGEHYIKSLDENGNENPKYFDQDSELDAYAFSYALMKYKYKDVDLYVPKYYDNEFYSIVEDWLKYFKNYDEE